jgi:hypothetical protein
VLVLPDGRGPEQGRGTAGRPCAEEVGLRKRGVIAASAACVLVSALGSGCGALWRPESRADLAPARAALRAAEEIRAEEEPVAALHVGLARGELANAERLVAIGEQREAAAWAARAQSDAELAVLAARAASVRDAAKRTLEEAGALRGSVGVVVDGGVP